MVLGAAPSAWAAPPAPPLVERVDEGEVDWRAGVVRVQGSGRPRRISPHVDIVEGDLARAAAQEVEAKLLSTSRALPLDAGRSVGVAADADETLGARLAEAVRGYETLSRTTVSDNSVSCEWRCRSMCSGGRSSGAKAEPRRARGPRPWSSTHEGGAWSPRSAR